MLIRKHYPN